MTLPVMWNSTSIMLVHKSRIRDQLLKKRRVVIDHGVFKAS